MCIKHVGGFPNTMEVFCFSSSGHDTHETFFRILLLLFVQIFFHLYIVPWTVQEPLRAFTIINTPLVY